MNRSSSASGTCCGMCEALGTEHRSSVTRGCRGEAFIPFRKYHPRAEGTLNCMPLHNCSVILFIWLRSLHTLVETVFVFFPCIFAASEHVGLFPPDRDDDPATSLSVCVAQTLLRASPLQTQQLQLLCCCGAERPAHCEPTVKLVPQNKVTEKN